MTFSPPFVHTPFPRLRDNLTDYIKSGIQPEIGLEGTLLYDEPQENFVTVAQALHQAGLPCTLHAPFFELYPGSLDPKIRQASRAKLALAFDLLPIFRPQSIVCHLGFEDNKHGYKEEKWFQHSLEAWQELTHLAATVGTIMMLENTYEQGPKQLKRMLQALNSPQARFCLDVGHILAFAKNNWQDWLPEMSPYLGQLHLHDNHGDRDLHLAIGEGIFDFAALFTYLREQQLTPLLTIEPHHQGGREKSLTALAKLI